jgi:hypothetical protein
MIPYMKAKLIFIGGKKSPNNQETKKMFFPAPPFSKNFPEKILRIGQAGK